MRIGILGAGHAGLALFACIHQLGASRPVVYSSLQHDGRLRAVLAGGGELALDNGPAGTRHVVRMVGDDFAPSIASLVARADLVFNTIPVQAHDAVFDEVLRSLPPDRPPLTYVNLGGGFSIFSHIAHARSLRRNICLGTFHTLPFASRVSGGEAQILNIRKQTSYAFHGGTGAECVDLLRRLFPSSLERDENILHMSLDRSSYVMHPLVTIFNVNRIDRNEEFLFYRDGFCASVKNLLARAGYERRGLARALGFFDYPDPVLRLESFEANYAEDFKTIRAPASLVHRYIQEDIPFGLVPICGLGEVFGLAMPISRSIVDIASAIAGHDFWDSPYNLHRNPVLLGSFLEGQRPMARAAGAAGRAAMLEVAP